MYKLVFYYKGIYEFTIFTLQVNLKLAKHERTNSIFLFPFRMSQFHSDQSENRRTLHFHHVIRTQWETNGPLPLVSHSISNLWSLKRTRIGRMERSKWNIWNSILTLALMDSCRNFTDGTLACGRRKVVQVQLRCCCKDISS